MKELLYILIIIFILYVLMKPQVKINNTINHSDNRIKVWTYVPQESNKYRNNFRYPYNNYDYAPTYIKLTIKSLFDNLDSNLYNIQVLDKDNIHSYLPDFPLDLNNENRYKEKDIMDLLGGKLLYKYGGLWLYPGTVTLKRNYNDLYLNLINRDIVTFGSTNAFAYDDRKPNNYIIGSKPNNPVIKQYIKRISDLMMGKIESLHKHVDIDFNPLGESIELFNVKHKHYCSLSDGTYNIHGRKLHMEDYLGKTPINYSKKLMFISFPYEQLDIETDYRWFKFSTMEDLNGSNINLIKYL
jgi:hypothetical protein